MTKLKTYMQDKGWTKQELAKKIGCSTGIVERFMKVGLTQHNKTVLFARAMGCKVKDIMEDR